MTTPSLDVGPPASGAPAAPAVQGRTAWAPLRIGVFRALWIAALVSNVGTWMQTVGAQWLLVEEPNAAMLVALVQTAQTVPVFVLALPAGVLADVFDRRRLMIAAQLFQGAVAILLTVLTFAGKMPPALLLTLTFLLGAGTMVVIPAFQASVPEIVPRAELPAASALSGMTQNVGRAVGPAIAGFVVATAGPAATFAVNATTFFAFAAVLWRWRRPVVAQDVVPERVGAALRAGARYVRHSPVVRRFLLRGALFVGPATALWALLPLAANRLLGLGSAGYGLLLAALGTGAVLGAIALPHLYGRVPTTRLIAAAGAVFTVMLVVLALVRSVAVVVLVLLPTGAAWTGILSTLGAAMQLFLPSWVRARALSVFQVVVFGGMALAAVGWGLTAEHASVSAAFLGAAVLMLLGTATVAWWPLIETSGFDRSPAEPWPEPSLALDPSPDTGPVLVTVTYEVPPERVPGFLEAMDRVRRSRLRTGAVRWELFQDGGAPDRFVEQFLVPSWGEHLRQHVGRLTETDRAFEREAIGSAEAPPVVAHLFPPSGEGRRRGERRRRRPGRTRAGGHGPRT